MYNRYSRQTILQNIGEEGQEKLTKSSVAVVGCGALGSTVSNNLARAGVGKLIIIDRDFVELSNLQRQMLFDEDDVGKPKAIAACGKLEKINSDIEIEPVVKDLNHTNVEKILGKADLVMDGTDNILTRMLVNDVCDKQETPWIYTGAVGTSGMTMNILPGKACMRCLYPTLHKTGSLPTCDTMGILNTITTIMGSMETTEALKILLGNIREGTDSSLRIYDAWSNSLDEVVVHKNEECPCCIEKNYEYLEIDERELITSLCGRSAIQVTPADPKEISLDEMADKLGPLGEVKNTPFILIFKTENEEISLFKDGRAIIKGTNNEKAAQSLYARYIGT